MLFWSTVPAAFLLVPVPVLVDLAINIVAGILTALADVVNESVLTVVASEWLFDVVCEVVVVVPAATSFALSCWVAAVWALFSVCRGLVCTELLVFLVFATASFVAAFTEWFVKLIPKMVTPNNTEAIPTLSLRIL